MAYKKPEEDIATWSNTMFFDVESVPQYKNFEDMPERLQNLFLKKFYDAPTGEDDFNEFYRLKASTHAEFGKVACISFAIIAKDDAGALTIRLKTFAGKNEKAILTAAAKMLNKLDFLSGHNIKRFDLGFLGRRYLLNGMSLPPSLQVMGKKPWEIKHVDTMEMWAFGNLSYTVSLDLLAESFGLPSPKTLADGSGVWRLFYEIMDTSALPWDDETARFNLLGAYCEGDTATGANLWLCMNGLAPIPVERIILTDREFFMAA